MTRRVKAQAVRKKRIARRRNYGFDKISGEYSKLIQSSVLTKTDVTQLLSDYRDVATAMRNTSTENMNDIFMALNKRLIRIQSKLEDVFRRMFQFGGKKVMDNLGNRLKLDEPDYTSEIDALRTNNLKYVKNLAQDQREKIVELLAKGFKEGTSYADITKQIVSEVKDFTKNRAELIAKTEMNRATSISMELTMRHNLIDEYLYVTAEDNRVSEICLKHSYISMTNKNKGYRRYKVGDGPLPVRDSHPRCRCVIVKAPDS